MKSLVLGLVLLATANIQIGSDPDYGEYFSGIIRKAAMRLQEVGENRPLKLHHWNESLKKTAEAVRLMATRGSVESMEERLEEAREAYPGNSFAILLQAILKNARGDEEEANRLFESFLLESRKFTELEETFLHWGEFHMLRRTVFGILRSRGVSFEGREQEIQAYIPYEEFFKYIMDPGREDWMMNVALVLLIVGGAVLLGVSGLMGVDLGASPASSFVTMYVVVWIAYAIWILDLAFGLPFGLSRMSVVPLLLAAGAMVILTLDLAAFWSESRRPLEEGYKKCPHCGAIIVELSTECLHCRKKV